MSTITKKHHLKKMVEKNQEIERLNILLKDVTEERDHHIRRANDYAERINVSNRKDGVAIGEQVQARTQMEKAVQRAHRELESIKPSESSTTLLVRMLGNVQGILAAALDGQHNDGELRAPAFDPYPDETERKRIEEYERNNRPMYGRPY